MRTVKRILKEIQVCDNDIATREKWWNETGKLLHYKSLNHAQGFKDALLWVLGDNSK